MNGCNQCAAPSCSGCPFYDRGAEPDDEREYDPADKELYDFYAHGYPPVDLVDGYGEEKSEGGGR